MLKIQTLKLPKSFAFFKLPEFLVLFLLRLGRLLRLGFLCLALFALLAYVAPCRLHDARIGWNTTRYSVVRSIGKVYR